MQKNITLLPVLLHGKPFKADHNIAVNDDGYVVLLEDPERVYGKR